MEEQLKEVLSYLAQPNPNARLHALTILCGFSSEDSHLKILVKIKTIPKLIPLIAPDPSGAYPTIAEHALKTLVNLSASDNPSYRRKMIKKKIFGVLSDCLKSKEPHRPNRRLQMMLLTNLTVDEYGHKSFLQLDTPLKGLDLLRILNMFVLRDDSGYESKDDVFEYAAQVLCNLTATKEARDIILDPERKIVPKLVPFLSSPNRIRRVGIAKTLRNCCFETDKIPYLTSEEVGLVQSVSIALTGPEGLDEDELKELLPAVRNSIHPEKTHESDDEIRHIFVEMLQLCVGDQPTRMYFKSIGMYYILRELHKWEFVDETIELIEDLVQFLARDEAMKDINRGKNTAQIEVLEEKESCGNESGYGSDDSLERELAELEAEHPELVEQQKEERLQEFGS